MNPAARPRTAIDLNADVGEGATEDVFLIPLVTSINVACGAHAGDAQTIAQAVAIAVKYGVAAGAHPSYPDRAHFGRHVMNMPPADLVATIVEQVSLVADVVSAAGTRLRHVKPHGALYNQSARDLDVATLVAQAVRAVSPDLILVGLAGSVSLSAARAAGLAVAAEAFADRRYEADGRLRDRRHPDASIEQPDVAAAQAVSIARDAVAAAVGGSVITVSADTICLHGEQPGAAERARAIRHAFDAAGIKISTAFLRNMSTSLRLLPLGDSAILILVGDAIDERINAQVHAIAAAVERLRSVDTRFGRPVPAYGSVLVPVDPLNPGVERAVDRLWEVADSAAEGSPDPRDEPLLEIPTRYGGPDGPDLDDIAALRGLRPAAVIELHASVEYRAYFLGFAPGFAYLGRVPEAIAAPRLAIPRPRVPAGSVGIAGEQTAIYPVASPGGWRILGRTNARLWNPAAADPALIRPGSRVRFVPIA